MPIQLPRPAAAAVLCAGLWPGIVAAEAAHSLSGTIVGLRPTLQEGAVAEVFFENRAVNSAADDSSFVLDMTGVRVQITYRWNTNPQGDDEITIETDPEHVAVPRVLVVHEGQSTQAYVYPLESVGY